MIAKALSAVLVVASIVVSSPVLAHHVLGRPAYALNEDSNTPPSMQVETQIGDYFINYMVYPAFPRPNEPGRINLYASRIDNGRPFDGDITFKVRDAGWFSGASETLGRQVIDDNVYRQGFEFSNNGDYIISAEFEANGEPYTIDFPLRVGPPSAIGPLGITIAVIISILIGVSIIQRRRSLRGKIRQARDERSA